MVVVQKKNNMERKTKSAFKLRSGNKPSPAKLMGIVGRGGKELLKKGKKRAKRVGESISTGARRISSGFSAMGARLGLHGGDKGYLAGSRYNKR